MEYFIEAHYCDSENIKDNLLAFGTKKQIVVMPDKLKHIHKFDKERHDKFTILFYLPKRLDMDFCKWLYGYDIFLKIKERLPDFHYLVVEGNSDMKYVYPFVDFYLRPNRHDGASRMRRECEIQDIPYYWTQKDPSVREAIKAIEDVAKSN